MSNASLHGRSRKLMAIFARVKQSAQAIQIRRNPFFHFLRVVSPPNLKSLSPFCLLLSRSSTECTAIGCRIAKLYQRSERAVSAVRVHADGLHHRVCRHHDVVCVNVLRRAVILLKPLTSEATPRAANLYGTNSRAASLLTARA